VKPPGKSRPSFDLAEIPAQALLYDPEGRNARTMLASRLGIAIDAFQA
jgi:hypothetical protein